MQIHQKAEENVLPSTRSGVRMLRRGDFMALLYFTFSMFDWFFSKLAFQMGVPEGNPFLAWCQRNGLFTPIKLGLTLAATGLIFVLYSQRSGRMVSHAGVLLMALLTIYHLIGLNLLLS